MWPDPTDLSRRKPHFLGGTPANKASHIVTFIAVSTIIGVYHLISYTPWFEKKIQRHREIVKLQVENIPARQLLADPVVRGAIENKRLEYDSSPLAED